MKKVFFKINFFLQFIVPVIFVAGIIFYLSAQLGLGDIKNNVTETFLRKGAHFTEYGLLAFFVWRLFYNGLEFLVGPAFWFSLILTSLYACSDEFHQTFVAGRSGKPVDVLVDFFSIFIILQFILFFIRRRVRNIILMFVGVACLVGLVSLMAWQSCGMAGKSEREIILKDDISPGVKSGIDSDDKKEQDVSKRIVGSVKKSGDVNKDKDLKDGKNFNNDNFAGNDFDDGNLKREVFTVEKLPKKVVSKVLFTTQAPFAKWDELHEEACEETSLIMLKYYNDISGDNFDDIERGELVLTKQKAEEEIQKLIKYQIKKYGDYFDTDVETTKEIGEDFYGLKNLKIIENFTIQDLKRELAQGNIILVPTAGRELGNPNFTPPGPLYHNLVIIGYDDTQTIDSAGHKAQGVFITNDPGTRRGQNYKYDQQVLYKAIHDFPGDVNRILEGKKKAVVLVGGRVASNK